MPYLDLHDHIKLLEECGLLYRISRPIDKNSELHALVRLQFRGLPEDERKAFLFENVTDASGRRYQQPVLASALAPSRKIYALGMQCAPGEIGQRWVQGISRPIAPTLVTSAKCQERIHWVASDAGPGTGLDLFPIPISTPGFDPAPFTTCSHWVTHDPETGTRNVGNYRGHVKAPNRIGLALLGPNQGLYAHWTKARAAGKPLEAAIVIGAPPLITYAAASKVPAGLDELSVAGSLAGEAIPVVRCKTVDVIVPADAEIVIEGRISTEHFEPEGPFGEFYGHVHPIEMARFMDITCITCRSDCVWTSLVSQLAPSESSVMRRLSTEALFLAHLRDAMGIKSVKRVIMTEELLSVRKLAIIQMENPHSDQARRALLGAASYQAACAKIVIAVDADIDPEDLTSIMWAVGVRAKLDKDLIVVPGFDQGMMPPFEVDDQGHVAHLQRNSSALMLIDATMKEPLPPVALPKQHYMDKALAIWSELGLPKLDLRSPWYGYSLGQWNEHLDEAAEAAVRGDYYRNGEHLSAQRKPVDNRKV